jgi:hypothetical protein
MHFEFWPFIRTCHELVAYTIFCTFLFLHFPEAGAWNNTKHRARSINTFAWGES